MSFLDSIISSIESGKPTPIPTSSPAPSPTISSSNTKPESRKATPTARPTTVERNNGVPTGTKRKAEEPLPRTQKPGSQIPARPAAAKLAATKSANVLAPSSQRLAATSKIAKPSTSSNAPIARNTPPAPSKPAPKGSFADIMAQAKAAQQKAPTQVGMFKHQSVPKEKLSKMERKKRMIEAQAKDKDSKLAKKPGPSSSTAAAVKPGSAKAALKREPEELTYKGTARQTPSQPEYRGTANLPSRNGARRVQSRANKRSRMDDYLGTDEEDEGDYADDYDDYYSESSDMEAGMDDVEAEEAAALAAARREDEEDIRAEAAAKKEKMERRKKLTMLASKRH
ncbi:uncharacterized protein DSM5745_02457 [Aspergillus mulundensis]|uniref:SPT2 chromatin protein n=1 Tax=Aspergillus mulundensis TaxID=1810919 RepID=A0A3D8SWI4_9EURO|nr:Uncharacterized protein DSM5745_02457 [Aspergillus mulundensis]RDW90682.1 Uncharacterized protein DSM5745_02457 [Aspergillus mulundensis]